MTKEQRDNCFQLMNVIQQLPDQQCNMVDWAVTTEWKAWQAGPQKTVAPQRYPTLPPVGQRAQPGCGTTACLAGWAVTVLTPATRITLDCAVIDADWLNTHHPRATSYANIGSMADNEVAANIPNLGRELLGEEVAQYFFNTVGKKEFDFKTDKEFMLHVLGREIMHYDMNESKYYQGWD